MNQPITKEGLNKLNEKESDLKKIRKELVEKREELSLMMGDQSENSDYQALLEEIENVERQLKKIELGIFESIITKTSDDVKTIKFGHYITLINSTNENDKREYQIVGTHESDILKNKISNISPVAIQLLGKEIDDEIQIGEETYYIKEIKA